MSSLSLQNLSFSYQGKKILQDFSLTIPEGTHLALMGPSGSGKTTLLRLIAGLERDTRVHHYSSKNLRF